ncbi:helix-turn-helix domain-containing protein [Mycobacterium sp. AMU20-3851]|uniref:winged helix-turn-helix transcriptional regulator n=1 Tax=Mycobacterium sp. AMU20-3851 TaxID=3122055 RepID=UPI003753F94C
MAKEYGHYCGLARSLDVVGDRWNLLIVRQLLIAPARYGTLRDGLPGVATNLLADRLRDLEAAGVIERRLGEAGLPEYALTAWGAELRDPIEGLIRWSGPLMVRGPQGDHFRAEWLLLALPALFAHRTPPDRTATIAVEVHEGSVHLHATPSGVTVTEPGDHRPEAVIRAEAPVILGLAAGMLTLDTAAAMIDVSGDTDALRTVFAAAPN